MPSTGASTPVPTAPLARSATWSYAPGPTRPYAAAARAAASRRTRRRRRSRGPTPPGPPPAAVTPLRRRSGSCAGSSPGSRTPSAVWTDAVAALADGLLTGIALYDPELIVLGGGFAESGSVLLDPLREALEKRRTFHRLPPLARAELGDEAGCLGAALLALDLLASEPTKRPA